MTEIEELIETAEQVLARLSIPESVRPLYIEGYIDGLYIEAVVYRVILW